MRQTAALVVPAFSAATIAALCVSVAVLCATPAARAAPPAGQVPDLLNPKLAVQARDLCFSSP